VETIPSGIDSEFSFAVMQHERKLALDTVDLLFSFSMLERSIAMLLT
jgi:hypothetical protein